MGNTFLTPQVIAKEALMVLRNNAVMANLVYRDYSNEFAAVGDTITVRKPANFTANVYDRSAGLTVQDATEESATVKMDTLLDVSFAVTFEQMSLDIADFSKQLLVPAMQAFADKVDNMLISLADTKGTQKLTTAKADKENIIEARKYLTQAAAPNTDRAFVLGAESEADLLGDNGFTQYMGAGELAIPALSEANLGRKFGFDIYTDQNVNLTGYEPNLAFHKNAMALVTRTPSMPLGSTTAHAESYDGFGLRVVYGYDMAKKTDTVSIDMLCGVAMLDPKLIVEVKRTTA